MRKYIFGAFALAAVSIAATAVPAFSADNGAVGVSVTAQAPPAPCLTVTPGNVNFGTLPFTTPTSNGYIPSSAQADITTTNCGTAGQNLYAATSDATGPGGSWTPLPFLAGGPDVCTAPNRFFLTFYQPNTSNPVLGLIGTPAPILASYGGSPAVYPAGDSHISKLTFTMPCQGSTGAGEQKTLMATFTAVVP